MMEQIQEYLASWYRHYHQLEQDFLGNSFSSFLDAHIMIDNFKLNQLLRDLIRHYCHFRLLRICPTSSLWIRGMIWKLCCDQFCCQLPPCLPFSSDVSIYDRKFKKLIVLDDIKKIIRAGKTLVANYQSHLHITLHKDLPTNLKRPCPPLSLQVNLQSLNVHFNTIQHILKESSNCQNHDDLVRHAKDLREYHHIIDFTSEYGYIKALCCYQSSLKAGVVLTEKAVTEDILEPSAEGEIKIDQPEGTPNYCYCQDPENDALEMVYCEKCQSWYHCQCVGILKKKDLKELENTMVEYICLSCAVKLGQEYPYLKPKTTRKRKKGGGEETGESVKTEKTTIKLPKREKEVEASPV